MRVKTLERFRGARLGTTWFSIYYRRTSRIIGRNFVFPGLYRYICQQIPFMPTGTKDTFQ